MQKTAIEIKPGLRFKDGDVTFHVIGPVENSDDKEWYVRISVPGGGGFARRTSKPADPIKMSSEKILKLAEASIGDLLRTEMVTIGNNSGAQRGSQSRALSVKRQFARSFAKR